MIRRASRSERSSWPRWTPSQLASRARSTRSFMIRGTRACAVRIRTSRARRSSSRSGTSFLAILDHVGAAGQSLAHDPGQIAERRQTADQDHQPGVAEPPVGGDGGHRQFLERVDVVAQHLETAGEPDVDQLGVFLQRPQGLGDPLEVGRQHGAWVFADLLGGRHDVRADVLAGVAGAEQEVRIEPALGLGQPVANFLESPGEPGIVEHEANVILDDPQSLPRRLAEASRIRARSTPPPGSLRLQRVSLRPAGVGTSRPRSTSVKRSRRLELRGRPPGAARRPARSDVSRPASRCSVPTSRLRSMPRACIVASLKTSRNAGESGSAPGSVPRGRHRRRRAPAASSSAERFPRSRWPEPAQSRSVSTPNSASSCAARLSDSSRQRGQQVERLDARRLAALRQPIGPSQALVPHWP